MTSASKKATRGKNTSWYYYRVTDRSTGAKTHLHSADQVISMLGITMSALKWQLHGKRTTKRAKTVRKWEQWKVERTHTPCWRHKHMFWRIRKVLRAKYRRALCDLVDTVNKK